MNTSFQTKKILVSSALLSLLTLNMSCSGSATATPGSSSETVNEFSSLPEVTGPVTSNAPASIRPNSNVFPLGATTGVVLSSADSSTFTGASLQMCENANLAKEVLREASQADKILCYMGAMKSATVIPSSVTIADGEFHYMKLVNLPFAARNALMKNSRDQSSEPRIKFKVVKENNTITSFQMWSCFQASGQTPVQSEYIIQTFSGADVTVSTRNTGSENGSTYGSSMTAVGTFENGSWTSKNISGTRFHSNGGHDNGMSINLDQYADTLSMSIAMGGRFGASTFTNRFFTVVEILNSNSIATLALGDGSSKYNMSYDQDSDNTPEFTNTGVVSWNGDTRANLGTASDGILYTTANNGSVPAAPTPASITFSGDAAWDCELPNGETWVEADFQAGGSAIMTGMNACNDKYIDGGSWIQCPYQ